MQKMTATRKTVVLVAGLVAMGTQVQAWEPNPPRPPLPIPNVVALMPPTVPLTRSAPTPIPPPTPAAIPIPPQPPIPRPAPAIMPAPWHVPLPPVEFDHPYAGKLTVLREDNYAFIRHVCKDTTPPAVACSFRTYDSITGETISCLIMLGPMVHDDERALRHEIGHCNGWGADHRGARAP